MAIELRAKEFDIETGFNLVRVHSLFQYSKGGSIPPGNIAKERYIICASFKNLDSKAVRSYDVTGSSNFDKDPTDDKSVVEAIYNEFEDTDAVIGHNSKRFDTRRVAARGAFWGFGPLKPVIQIDTLLLAKKYFDFNSNRLDYLGKFLGVGGKRGSSDGLWVKALAGDRDAIAAIVRYNRRDVRLLHDVYVKLAPWGDSKLNYGLELDGRVCPLCGSEHVQSRGVARNKTRKYNRFCCADCGHWFRGTKSSGGTQVTSL